MKRLLIITGPQGSGNHLFSRVFSTHPNVGGWKKLLDEYWVPSDLEPFAEYWVYPERMTAEAFEGHDYWLANVSVPFVYDGVRQTPKILEMANRAKELGVDVTIAIIVRDQNIQAEQQLRVRKEVTLPIAQDYYYNQLLTSDFPVHFLDNEAFFLHKQHYLKWASKLLDFPVDYDNPDILKFITEDPNRKYVKHVNEYWLDEQVWHGIQPKSVRGLDK
jgi:hypothetical protein